MNQYFSVDRKESFDYDIYLDINNSRIKFHGMSDNDFKELQTEDNYNKLCKVVNPKTQKQFETGKLLIYEKENNGPCIKVYGTGITVCFKDSQFVDSILKISEAIERNSESNYEEIPEKVLMKLIAILPSSLYNKAEGE